MGSPSSMLAEIVPTLKSPLTRMQLFSGAVADVPSCAGFSDACMTTGPTRFAGRRPRNLHTDGHCERYASRLWPSHATGDYAKPMSYEALAAEHPFSRSLLPPIPLHVFRPGREVCSVAIPVDCRRHSAHDCPSPSGHTIARALAFSGQLLELAMKRASQHRRCIV
jgi:hypothetical protein